MVSVRTITLSVLKCAARKTQRVTCISQIRLLSVQQGLLSGFRHVTTFLIVMLSDILMLQENCVRAATLQLLNGRHLNPNLQNKGGEIHGL